MSYEAVNNFEVTRHLFEDFLKFDRTKPLSFDEWSHLDRDQMVAALYCNFYDEITLAWYKVKTNYSYTDDGVDELIQYLTKNVDKILDNPKRFTPQYIYKVAYNCLYCLCLDPNQHKKRYENECSNITKDEKDLFDFIKSATSAEDLSGVKDALREQMWQEINDLGYDAVAVVNTLITDSKNSEDTQWSDFKGKRPWKRRFKTLQKTGELEVVLDQLRSVLAKYADTLGGVDLEAGHKIIRLSFEAWPGHLRSSRFIVQNEIGDIAPRDNWYRLYFIEYKNRYNKHITYTPARIVYPDEVADDALDDYIKDLNDQGLETTGRVIFYGYYTFNDPNHSEPTTKSSTEDFVRVSEEEYKEERIKHNDESSK